MKRASAVALLVLLAAPALAHVRQRIYITSGASKGRESIIHWNFSSAAKISMNDYSGNLGLGTTVTSITPTIARGIIGTSIAQWTASYLGVTPKLNLDLQTVASDKLPYLVANNCEYDPSNESKIDGVNNLVFTSKVSETCADLIPENLGIIGITKARFSGATGEIVEADIQFDDTSFQFLTSGNNDINPTTGPKKVNLGDVVTHEFGHLLGLDHSSSRTATMLFAVADNLRTTKDDDLSGMLSLYPPSDLSDVATVAGSVTTENGAPVFGTMVYLLDARTLKVSSSDFTNNNGAFEFCAVRPGPHLAFVNKYVPFGVNVHEYYTGSDGGGSSGEFADTCFNPGCNFMDETLTHTFWGEAPTGVGETGGLSMKKLQLVAGQAASYLNIVGQTSAMAMADVPGTATPSSSASEITLDEPRIARLSASDLGLAASASKVGYDAYTFDLGSTTSVRVSTAALSIYGRLKLELALYRDDAGSWTNVTSSCTAVMVAVNTATDPYLECPGLAADTYQVLVTGTTASCKDIPGNSRDCENSGVGESASTAKPYYLIAVVDNALVGSASGTGEDLEDTSAAATTHSNIPMCGVQSAVVGDSGKGGGCCGGLRDVANGPKGPPTLLLSLLFNPALLYAIYWGFARAMRRARARG